MTHYKDTVPHVPYESMGYLHIAGEVYEDEDHTLYGCTGPEDTTCGDQWAFIQTDISDHLLYLDHDMTCD
jgi:hypothetical protein